MNAEELLSAQELSRQALEELRAASYEVPAGPQREAVEARIKSADEKLELARSTAAKALGFKTHDCKFPPPLLLWNEAENAHICENCGHKKPRQAGQISRETSWITARRGGRDDWMGS